MLYLFMTDDIDKSLRLYVKAVLEKKSIDPVILDLRGLTSIADFFIICSARSNRQVMAIAEFIKADLKKHGIKPVGIEGIKEGRWVLINYGHVIIHIFYESLRSFYDIEGLWTDAKRISMERFTDQ